MLLIWHARPPASTCRAGRKRALQDSPLRQNFHSDIGLLREERQQEAVEQAEILRRSRRGNDNRFFLRQCMRRQKKTATPKEAMKATIIFIKSKSPHSSHPLMASCMRPFYDGRVGLRIAGMQPSIMSAIGTKRTSLVAPHMSAFGVRADMTFCIAHVCFDLKRTSTGFHMSCICI